MKLQTHLNLVVAGLTSAFVVALITLQMQSAKASIEAEIVAANRVAAHLLQPLAILHAKEGDPGALVRFLSELGRVRANDLELLLPSGEVIYRSPPPTYKAGRAAPGWFTGLLAPEPARPVLALPGGMQLIVQAHSSRAVLDAWDDLARLLTIAVLLLLIVNGIAFWLVARALAAFPVIAAGLDRLERGELAFRLPPLAGFEARMIGSAFNRMAQAIEGKMNAERKMREAETRLEERREMALLIEQRLEDERRLIAHELHDEFGQSVTAIRSLALAMSGPERDAATAEAGHLIAAEAARLYDAMHSLIPRLTPLSLDTLGLAETLQNLVSDWQRRYPQVALSVEQELTVQPGSSVALTVYRVVQEGLVNALRHAQPSRVAVSVECDARRLVVTVIDDGAGLPPDWMRPGRFGLRGLSERVEVLGGALSIADHPPRGTCLSAQIPMGPAT